MKRWVDVSLNTRIALSVSALFIVAAGAIAFWALALFEAEKRSELSSDAAALAGVIADNIDSKLQMTHAALIAVAASVPPSALQDFSESESFLHGQVALHALFDNGLFLVAPDGRLIGESPARPARRGSDVSAREYFHKTLETRKPYISKPYRSTHQPGQPALIMTAPVFNASGELIGLLYGSLDLLGSNILAEAGTFRLGRTGYLFLSVGRETMISHPDPSRIMRPMPLPGQNALFDRAVDGYEGSGETVTSTGIAMLQTFKKVKSTGWILGVNLPLEEFHAPIREARRYFLISTAAGTLVFLLIVWLLTRRLIAPLSSMTRQVQEMVVEPSTGRRLTSRSNDEIGVLGNAFNAMLDKLVRLNEELERRVADRTADLMKARDDAERANRAKSDFLAAMSHDLRTPMNAILGFSQLIESDTADRLSDKHRGQVREIRRAGSHLLELINDVLDLARVEAGKQPISLEPVQVLALLNDCLSLMQPLAREHGIRLPAEVPGSCACFVRADRIRLKQVLVNLLSNAIKYNRPSGSVEIHCTPIDADAVRISVSDSGPGLGPEQRERLFNAFDRLGADAGTIQGAGIGLVLSRRLVELMNGSIGVDSAPGRGSTFWIRLDRAEAVRSFEAPTAPAMLDAASSQPDGTTRRTVLYIEDNPVNVLLMEAILEREPGWRLIHSPLPEPGLETAEAQKPDLILLDIQLPGIDGYEVLRRLRETESTQAIPVIAISASAMHGEVERGLAAGFGDYLTKPIDVPRLLALLRAVPRE
jgi:signal transduction histidine kinase/ActR/RegA family two-component response regulator